jgi:hypothetical protein
MLRDTYYLFLLSWLMTFTTSNNYFPQSLHYSYSPFDTNTAPFLLVLFYIPLLVVTNHLPLYDYPDDSVVLALH